MNTPDPRILVAIYFHDSEEEVTAKQVLQRLRADQVVFYDGVVEAAIFPHEPATIIESGLLVRDCGPVPKPLIGNAGIRSRDGDSGAEPSDITTPLSEDIVYTAGRSEASSLVPNPSGLYLVRFVGAMSPDRTNELKQLRLKYTERFPPDKYLMALTPEQSEAVMRLPYFGGIEPYPPSDLPDDSGIRGLLAMPSPASSGEGSSGEAYRATLDHFIRSRGPDSGSPLMSYDLLLSPSEDVEAVREWLDTRGVSQLETYDRMLRFRANWDVLLGLESERFQIVLLDFTPEPPTLYADTLSRHQIIATPAGQEDVESQEGVESNEKSGASEASLRAMRASLRRRRWTGKGQKVGIFDSGIDPCHPDLRRRVVCHDALTGAHADDHHGHGTHVAGIVAGTGAASKGRIRGIAPDVELISIGIVDAVGRMCVPLDLGEMLKEAVSQGATIINLSWGNGLGNPIRGIYDPAARSLDEFIYHHPEVVLVVAAGNTGRLVDGKHELKTIGTPACAKNAVTVGAYDADMRGAPPFSSRGPTAFDTIKPDLLAPGVDIPSTLAAHAAKSVRAKALPGYAGRYARMTGTSMAAPHVSGAASVLKQYLASDRGCMNPSAALLKAILIASAEKLDPMPPDEYGFPDFHQGFGCAAPVQLDRVLPSADNPDQPRFRFVDIPSNSDKALESRTLLGAASRSQRTYSVQVAKGGDTALSIVLVWTDYPGSSLQNSLLLTVKANGGAWIAGNAEHRFRRDANVDRYPDGLVHDKYNNVEMVVVTDPPAGDCRIRVFADNVAFGSQGFALCVRGDLAGELQEV